MRYRCATEVCDAISIWLDLPVVNTPQAYRMQARVSALFPLFVFRRVSGWCIVRAAELFAAEIVVDTVL